MPFGIRITLRCWRDDFGYRDATPELAPLLGSQQPILRDFFRVCREYPDGTDGPLKALGLPFMKLKSGDRERGVTLWEEQPQGRAIQDPDLPFVGVVWLLGRGYRKEGDTNDAYQVFARLGEARLRPGQEDYERLYADIHRAVQEGLRQDLERALHELLEQAWREPGILHERLVESAELGVAIWVLDNAEYRIVVLPLLDSRNRAIPEEVLMSLVRVAFDDLPLDQLEQDPDPAVLDEVGYRPGRADWVLAHFRERKR